MTFICGMKSYKCPPAGYMIDLGVARFQATVVMLLSSLCLAVQAEPRIMIAAALLLDILPRALSRPGGSISGIVGKKLLKSLGFHPRRTDGAPKRFTSRISAALSLAILILSLMDQTNSALICSGILFVGSTLESLFDISIGCRIHGIWWSIFGRPRDPDQF